MSRIVIVILIYHHHKPIGLLQEEKMGSTSLPHSNEARDAKSIILVGNCTGNTTLERPTIRVLTEHILRVQH
jgi:hypothetical protein